MNNVEKFHALLRQYCIDRISNYREEHRKWIYHVLKIEKEAVKLSEYEIGILIISKFEQLTKDEVEEMERSYAENFKIDLSILQVILICIESLEPGKWSATDQFKEAVISTIDDYRYCVNRVKNEVKPISGQEKEDFLNFMHSIDTDTINKATPLFYRRVMSEDEVKHNYSLLNNMWIKRVRKRHRSQTEDILCIGDEEFLQKVDNSDIHKIFEAKGIERIFEIDVCNLNSASYEMDPCGFELKYKSGDIFWCSEKMDWAIIRDHEGLFYICSKWLVAEVNSIVHLAPLLN